MRPKETIVNYLSAGLLSASDEKQGTASVFGFFNCCNYWFRKAASG